MVKMAKIEAILGAARMRTIWRTKDNLEKGRQPPEKTSIFGKSPLLVRIQLVRVVDCIN